MPVPPVQCPTDGIELTALQRPCVHYHIQFLSALSKCILRFGAFRFACRCAEREPDYLEAGQGLACPVADVEHDDPCWFFFTSGTPAAQGGGADAWPDGLRHHQPSLRPDARHHRGRCLPRRGAAVARRRHPPARPRSRAARRRCCCRRPLRRRRSLAADRAAPGHQHVHRAHHPEDAGGASGGGPARPFVAAPRDLCRRADVPRGPEAGVGEAGQVLVQYFGLGEVTGNITVLPAAPARGGGRPGRRLGTCGFERTGMEIQIQDERGRGGPAGRDRRDLRLRPGGLRRLLRQPGGQRQGVPQRLVPHRRPRPDGCGGLPLHHRPGLRHVHLGRLQRLSARGRGDDPAASRRGRGRGARRARPAMGRGRRRRAGARPGQPRAKASCSAG